MAAVRAVDEYRSDLLAFLDELASNGPEAETREPGDSAAGTEDSAVAEPPASTVSVAGDDGPARVDRARTLLGRLRDRPNASKRSTATSSPLTADALTDAADAIGEYVKTGDESALDRARERLSSAAE